jgi:asparagine synthase (glutamine-hydrolysing)
MCGLYASIGLAPNDAALDRVAHRGPDGRGVRVFDSARGPIMLGHRRLSIIDLDDRAAQPMSRADGRFWLIFNGEVYNYVELRAELETLGERFATSSDSEVLLAAFARWGEAAFDRCVGMFAAIIWDARDQAMTLVRDRFGIKPLYFVASPQGFAAASEIKQLVDAPGSTRRINRARLADFLHDSLTDHTDETLFDGVRQLRAGELMRLDLARWRPGDAIPVRRWYDMPRARLPAMSEAQAAEQFRALFTDAVKLHLRADVRVGSCLSGGLDSSSIVMVMDRLLRGEGHTAPIHTVSACYAEKAVDEKPFMDQVVAAATCAPHFLYPRSDDVFALAEAIAHTQDEPTGSTSIFAQYCVFAEAREHRVKVMLDGQGADEQLAGYHGGFWHYGQTLFNSGDVSGIVRMLIERARWHGINPIAQLRTLYAHRLPGAFKRAVKSNLKAPPGADAFASAYLDNALKPEQRGLAGILARDGVGKISDIGDFCHALMSGASLPMLLRYEDRNSMAHSIEARVPFLDHRLVEFTMGLGGQHKLVGGDTKRVLRAAMAGILPEGVRQRRDKLGFSTPEEIWFRGPLRGLVHDGIEASLSRYPEIFNAAGVRAMRDSMLSGARPLDFRLWRIISVGLWGRLFGMSA